jgi:hypothetical protein
LQSPVKLWPVFTTGRSFALRSELGS